MTPAERIFRHSSPNISSINYSEKKILKYLSFLVYFVMELLEEMVNKVLNFHFQKKKCPHYGGKMGIWD